MSFDSCIPHSRLASCLIKLGYATLCKPRTSCSCAGDHGLYFHRRQAKAPTVHAVPAGTETRVRANPTDPLVSVQGGADVLPVRLRNTLLRILNRSLAKFRPAYIPATTWEKLLQHGAVSSPGPAQPPTPDGQVPKMKDLISPFSKGPASGAEGATALSNAGNLYGLQVSVITLFSLHCPATASCELCTAPLYLARKDSNTEDAAPPLSKGCAYGTEATTGRAIAQQGLVEVHDLYITHYSCGVTAISFVQHIMLSGSQVRKACQQALPASLASQPCLPNHNLLDIDVLS